MTLLVRDEEDIIRENIEFHLTQGVDFIIATDNLSEDSTTDILRDYEKKGVLKYILEEDDTYNQHAWVTRMARMACTDYKADWVINNDADEFWWPINGNLKSTFEGIHDRFKTLVAQRSDFVALEELNSKPFYAQMVFRKTVSLNSIGKPLPPKMAHRGNAHIEVMQGNHSIRGFGENPSIHDLIEILHFPLRSRSQFERKIAKGGAAYDRNSELKPQIGRTWRHLYSQQISPNGLDNFMKENLYTDNRLKRELNEGKLIHDARLKEYLEPRGF